MPFDLVWKAIRYDLKWVFYLPENTLFGMKEGIVRLDYMTTIHSSWFAQPHKAQLSPDALKCLQEWVRNFVYGAVLTSFKNDLLAYREMLDTDPSFRSSLGV